MPKQESIGYEQLKECVDIIATQVIAGCSVR